MGGGHAATVGAAVNMCGNIGAALFPIAVPLLLRVTGSWNAVLLGFGAFYVAAAACWFLLRTEANAFDPKPRAADA